MKKAVLLAIMMLCLPFIMIHGEQTEPSDVTVLQVMNELKKEHNVNFVYDSSIRLDVPYMGPSLNGRPLKQSLNRLFRSVGLKWERNGKYIVIFPRKDYTVSGYVTQDDGETVINATVQDTKTGAGTLTNEHGFYSLTLPEGPHTLRYSFIGYTEELADVNLNSNQNRNIVLRPGEELEEVVVTADLNSPLHTTQTGKISLTAKDLNREYALLSSPDVVKTLQTLSGVAAGTEVTSGLYVHGGSHDQNLFMLDGTPLYQVNHLGGLFSSFNTDVVKNIDFYKSGFPARYGGRLSSVVDVRTRDGNMKEYHGSFSIGLLDGRLQFEGPIVKNRTSFNIGLRRTWLDLITIPAFAIYNSSKSVDEKINMRYAFHDFNAKITHIFSERSRADINLFSGNDVFRATDDMDDYYGSDGTFDREYTKINLEWGNVTAAFNWKYQFSPKFYSVFTGIYTYNKSITYYMDDIKTYNDDKQLAVIHNENRNRATINDIGCRMEFDYRPDRMHHLRFGSNYLMHFFKPQDYMTNNFSGDSVVLDTVRTSLSHSFRGHELSVYAEDNMAFGERWRLNVGAHVTLFNIPDKTYLIVDPRVALRYQCSDRVTLKASYTEMSQYMHQLSNSYLNLPVDYWVPSTSKVEPSRARQYAAGMYFMFPHNVRLNVEGFYKDMRNLIEYDGGSSLTPPYDNWDSRVRKGRGRAYGLEIEAGYGNEHLSVSGSYTLSWNERRFADFYKGWYPDKFDNRHKINVNLTYKLKKGIDVYAGWSFHSGNRMTVARQVVIAPVIPGATEDYGGVMDPSVDFNQALPYMYYVYDKPNNLKLDAYHRLDLGINFRKPTKRGGERIWNISIYNAYNRHNPFFAKVQWMPDGSFKGKSTAVFPIIPSFSYTLKF